MNASYGSMIFASHLKRDNEEGLTVRPELVEGWTVKPFMVRQGSPEVSKGSPRTA
jgi:hypothetical protein